MEIILTSVQSSLAKAWKTFCGDLDFVKFHEGSILDLKCSAVVSPANSFGFMDGGIDGIYMDHFGKEIQLKVLSNKFYPSNKKLLLIKFGSSFCNFNVWGTPDRVP